MSCFQCNINNMSVIEDPCIISTKRTNRRDRATETNAVKIKTFHRRATCSLFISHWYWKTHWVIQYTRVCALHMVWQTQCVFKCEQIIIVVKLLRWDVIDYSGLLLLLLFTTENAIVSNMSCLDVEITPVDNVCSFTFSYIKYRTFARRKFLYEMSRKKVDLFFFFFFLDDCNITTLFNIGFRYVPTRWSLCIVRYIKPLCRVKQYSPKELFDAKN